MAEIGFALSEQFPAPEQIELGIAAEQAGFDRVWAADHLQPWMDNQNHSTQAWVMLGALGQRTQHLSFGTGVTCPTYRYNPAIVAQAFATLGLLYPGRVFLGVGSGEALNEHPATGKWDKYKQRIERLTEAVEIIRSLWSGERLKFKGHHYQIEDLRLYDLPAQPVPLYIAASGPKSAYLAGKLGDGLITDAKSALKPEMRQAFEKGAREAGKDVSRMPILAEHFVVVGGKAEAQQSANYWRFIPKAWTDFVHEPDPREIQRKSERFIADEEVTQNWVVSDSPEAHASELRKLIEGGVSQIYIHAGQLDQRRVIDFYGNEVLPLLQNVGAGIQRDTSGMMAL